MIIAEVIIMKDITPTSIRIEKEIMDRVREDAKKDKRSVTAQIEFIIEKYYEIKDNLKGN